MCYHNKGIWSPTSYSQPLVPRVRQQEIVVQELPDELLVYDLRRHQAYCLNRTAALIWQECDGQKTVGELTQILAVKAGANLNEAIVWRALEQLERHQLLETNIGHSPQAARWSRRTMLRQVGSAMAIGLPAITSIVAPTAVLAASCLTLGAACQPGGVECCDNTHATCGDQDKCCLLPGASCSANSDCCFNSCKNGVCVNPE